MLQGRTFTASLKPSWSQEMIEKFLNDMIGTADVWIINHNQDVNEDTGEIKEEHTHIMMSYKTPRKVATIANLLGVASNFVEVARNKRACLLYLTHKNAPNKYQYDNEHVFTNSKVPYDVDCLKDSLTDREIIELIKEGRTNELIDVVAPSRINQLSQIIHFNLAQDTNSRVKELEQQLDAIKKQNQIALESFNEMLEINKLFIEAMPNLLNEMLGVQSQMVKANNLATRRIK